jgi:hypothetical protein
MGNVLIKLDTFTAAYVEAALEWSEDYGVPLSRSYSWEDLHPDSQDKILEDCQTFVSDYGDVIKDRLSQAGEDLFKSRNELGGFEDAPIWNSVEAVILYQAALAWGRQTLYLGDDGLIHV